MEKRLKSNKHESEAQYVNISVNENQMSNIWQQVDKSVKVCHQKYLSNLECIRLRIEEVEAHHHHLKFITNYK